MLLETLEGRRLMSVSLNNATGLLTITGTAGEDAIDVSQSATKVTVGLNDVVSEFAVAKVKKIAVYGKASTDFINFDVSVTKPVYVDTGTGQVGYGDYVTTGSGDDVIDVHSPFSIISGGAGNDTINNFAGGNALYGDAGNDILVSKS